MTCRSSYYLQGTWPTEILCHYFVWFGCVSSQIFWKILSIFSVFMPHSYIKMLVSHLLSLWRAANVFSCAYILNLARPPHCQIPRQYQQALWYSGMSAIKYVLFWWVCHKLSRLNFHASNYWRLLIKGLEELWLLPSLFSLFMIFLVDTARQFLLLPRLLLF